MLKKLENHSFLGVVLFVSVLYLGLFLRIFGIETNSSWGDEVASLYYAQHLDRVFFYESHTPFYYGLCRLWMTIFPETILSLRYMFVSLSLFFALISSYVILKKRNVGLALVCFVLLWLWPTDISYSRQARHYSLFYEMCFLLLVLWGVRAEISRKVLWAVWATFQLIHPFALIPVFFLMLWDFVRKKLSWHEIRFFLTTSLPLVGYYLVRFFFFGRERVLSNISWVNFNFDHFVISVFKMFAGDIFPFNNFYPLGVTEMVLIPIVTLAIFLIPGLINRKKIDFWPLIRFVALFVLTLAIAEIVSHFFTNIRISRYFIFVVAFMLYGLFALAKDLDYKKCLGISFALAIVLGVYTMQFMQPWRKYTWDDENVESFKEFYKHLPERPLVICANAFQLDYFFQRKYVGCSEAALRLHLGKKDFYLFDLTGNDRMLALFLMNNAKIDNYEKFNQALFISVSYPPTKSP